MAALPTGTDHDAPFAERVDQLVSLDVASRNVIQTLYPLARRAAGTPLCMAAATLLQERVHPKDVVLIATGWPDRPHITPRIAETDGPPGAAALARSVHLGLGAVPVVLIEPNLVDGMARVMEASGLRVLTPEEALSAATSTAPIHAGSVLGFPTAAEEAEEHARLLLERLQPRAIVTIEKGGMNDRGVIHTSRGADTTEHMAKIDYLVRVARQRGIATIGIGDGGNEIGMANIAEGIKQHIPYGAKCRCGCGGGTAPSTPTDVLVAASISNWGAYGVAACLAYLQGEAEVLHDGGVELRVLEASASASFIDGISGFVAPSADGVPGPIHTAFVDLLRETVKQAQARGLG